MPFCSDRYNHWVLVGKTDFVDERKTRTMKTLLILCLSVTTLGVYAQQQVQTKDSPEAIEYANQINNLTDKMIGDPGNVDLYVKRAEKIYYLNAVYPHQTVSQFKLRDALVDIDMAIQADADNPKLYSIRGMYKRNITGDLAGARADLTKAIKLDPKNPQWYLERTNYSSLESACTDWKTCAELGNGVCEEIRTSVCFK